MSEIILHAVLKAKQRRLRADFPESMALRVHRSISWIGRAEALQGDHDACFLLLWIAFNAVYANEEDFQLRVRREREMFSVFFTRVIDLDKEQRIYNAIWQRFPGPIRMLLQNKYIFKPFWQHHHGIGSAGDWEAQFDDSNRDILRSLKARNTVRILKYVFERLYVLRNQLMHGGSTWNSSVNRDQLRDGVAILGFLMPLFVDVMMDNPNNDWGKPLYPVVS